MAGSARRRRRAVASSKPRTAIDPHQIEAWVDALGKLHIELPRTTSLSEEQIAQFLANHPEHEETMKQARAAMAAERQLAERLIGNIYSHYPSGSPSSWGLLLDLTGYSSLLEEHRKDRRR